MLASLAFVFTIGSSAADGKVYLKDISGVLTDSEFSEANKMLSDMSEKYGVDVVVFFVPEDVTDEEVEAFYDDGGYGTGEKRDGIITVIITDDYVTYNTVISLAGNFSEKSETSDAIAEFSYSFKQKIRDHDYVAVVKECVEAESRYIEKFNEEHAFHVVKSLLIAVVVGFIIALIIVLVMKGKLKSVSKKNQAADYVIPGSFYLRESRDLYLYSHVSRTPRADNSSRGGGGSHTSAGGVSHSTSRF